MYFSSLHISMRYCTAFEVLLSTTQHHNQLTFLASVKIRARPEVWGTIHLLVKLLLGYLPKEKGQLTQYGTCVQCAYLGHYLHCNCHFTHQPRSGTLPLHRLAACHGQAAAHQVDYLYRWLSSMHRRLAKAQYLLVKTQPSSIAFTCCG